MSIFSKIFKPYYNQTIQGYNLAEFDFLDLGSGTGESIDYCARRFKLGKGIGIDIKESKVIGAKSSGIPTIHADILELDIHNKFKFVSMMDFLEHLPSIEFSKKIITKASEIATDFLYIRHPSFENIEYLKSLDLKISWYDWKGHTSLLRLTDYVEIFNKLGLRNYCFNFRKPILSSSDKFILPLDAPIDSHEYDRKLHGSKKMLKFDKKIYGQIDIFVQLRDIPKEIWNKITFDKAANL